MTELTRRSMLAGAAARDRAAPLVATDAAQAAAPPAGTQAPGWYRYKVGSIEVTVVTDGANKFKFADDHVTNKKRDEINAALAAAYYEKDMMTTPYNPVVVNTGAKLVVIDTGTSEANFERSKGAAGQFQTQSRGRRHRSQRGRRRDHLALPRRSHQRAARSPTTSSPSRTPRSWCRRRSGSSSWTTAR